MAPNKHNEPLEQFFRDKTSEFDIPFNEADWDAMEQRLDEAQNAAFFSWNTIPMRMRYAAAAVLLFVLAGLGFVIYQNFYRINKLESQLSQQQIAQNEGNSGMNQKNSSNTKTENNFNGDINHNTPLIASQKNQTNGKKVSPSLSTSNDDQQNNTFRGTTLFSASEADMDFPYKITAIKASTKMVNPSKLETNLKASNLYVPTVTNGSKRNETNYRGITNKTYKETSALSLGIMAGPDLSTVGSLSQFYTPGYKIGALAEYNFNGKFSISTGVIYSNVNYTANGSQYNAPSGNWKYGITPLQTEAACAILSIPLRFKFNFAQLNSSRFYMTAGVSSYIMLNETYAFDYKQQDTSHLLKSWSGHTGTKHWLSNLTFSLGYEFDLNETIGLRIEPYLNIPVKRVGRANVKLFSTGTLISINYHFN